MAGIGLRQLRWFVLLSFIIVLDLSRSGVRFGPKVGQIGPGRDRILDFSDQSSDTEKIWDFVFVLTTILHYYLKKYYLD